MKFIKQAEFAVILLAKLHFANLPQYHCSAIAHHIAAVVKCKRIWSVAMRHFTTEEPAVHLTRGDYCKMGT